MSISIIFFDLDDTIYPSSSGIWPLIGQRINAYMQERLVIDPVTIPTMRRSLFEEFGTTMRGLEKMFHIDVHDYLAYVHDVPIEEKLKPNQVLRDQLMSYPQRRIIFTNADVNHARRVLTALNLQDCFDQIIDILQISPNCKPQPEAYLKALQISGEKDPRQCMVIDDSPANLQTASKLGFQTILVGGNRLNIKVDACIESLIDLPDVLTSYSHTIEE